MVITLTLPDSITMTQPIHVIRSIRALTNMGLKSAKMIIDDLRTGKSKDIIVGNLTNTEYHYNILNHNGIVFLGHDIKREKLYIRTLRNLSIRALKNRDYMVSIKIIEFIKSLDPNCN